MDGFLFCAWETSAKGVLHRIHKFKMLNVKGTKQKRRNYSQPGTGKSILSNIELLVVSHDFGHLILINDLTSNLYYLHSLWRCLFYANMSLARCASK